MIHKSFDLTASINYPCFLLSKDARGSSDIHFFVFLIQKCILKVAVIVREPPVTFNIRKRKSNLSTIADSKNDYP
jgi:hypothetical protein